MSRPAFSSSVLLQFRGACHSDPLNTLRREPRCGATFLLRRRIFCFVPSETGLTFRSVKRWFDRYLRDGTAASEAPRLLDGCARTPDRLASLLDGMPGRPDLQSPTGAGPCRNMPGICSTSRSSGQPPGRLRAGAPVLHPADLQNRRTHEPAQRSRPARSDRRISHCKNRDRRSAAGWSPAELSRVSRHPRSINRCRSWISAFFVAEHDDHHLAPPPRSPPQPGHARLRHRSWRTPSTRRCRASCLGDDVTAAGRGRGSGRRARSSAT
jgi:hypothetical protein